MGGIGRTFGLAAALAWVGLAAAGAEVSQRAAEAIRRFRANGDAAILRQALAVGRDPALVFALAETLATQGREQDALPLFEELAGNGPGFPGVHRNLGRLLVLAGREPEAVAVLKEGMRREGVDGDSVLLLGQCALKAEDWAAAEAALRLALVLRPADDGVRLALARAMVGQGAVAEAGRIGRAVAAGDPTNEAAWGFWMEAALARERGAAADVLEARRRIGGLASGGLLLLGDLYGELGLAAEAVDAYREAGDGGMRDPERLLAAARDAAEQGRADAARASATAALQGLGAEGSARLRAEACLVLARCEGDAGRRRGWLEQAVAADPGRGDGLIALAELEAAAGNVVAAVAHLRAARSLAGYRMAAMAAEAEVWLGERRYGEALGVLLAMQEVAFSPTRARLIRDLERTISESGE